MQRISLVSNSEQLSQPTGTTTNRGAAINNYNRSLEEEEAATAESQENVYHILENPEGDDVYEVLDKYKQKEEGQDEENMYHILDGPTVTEKEEESEGVATLSSSAITVEGHQTISQTSTSTDEY